jgi:hypothetical protein
MKQLKESTATNEATPCALQTTGGNYYMEATTGEGLSWPIDLPNTEANMAMIQATRKESQRYEVTIFISYM